MPIIGPRYFSILIWSLRLTNDFELFHRSPALSEKQTSPDISFIRRVTKTRSKSPSELGYSRLSELPISLIFQGALPDSAFRRLADR